MPAGPPAPPAWDAALAGDGEQALAGAQPSFYWECFACTAPWTALLALNGVEESLDMTGDDCHERNLSERARLLGYDVRLMQGLPVFDIDHRGFVAGDGGGEVAKAEAAADDADHDPLWERSESNTNVESWGAALSAIVDMAAPLRANGGAAHPNPIELWRACADTTLLF